MTYAEEWTRTHYPEHTCPDALDRHGDPRVGVHGPNLPGTGKGGELVAVCVLQTACGCAVTGNGTLMHPVMIEPCAKHRSEMYL